MKRDRFGRQMRKRKMTEERLRATNRFEKELRRMDTERLRKFDPLRIDWALVLLVVMAGFCAFYFLR